MKVCFPFFYSAAILVLGIFFGAVAVAQDDITTVDDSAFDALARPAALFNHEEHMEITDEACYICHHVYDEDGLLSEDESSEDFECSECHMTEGDPRHLGLVVRYHQRCKGCHEEEQAGPVVCSGCHVK